MAKLANAVIPVEDADIQRRQVTVEVLTLDKRQVTQSFYKQLVEESLIDYKTGEIKGEIWGWVNLHFSCDEGRHIHVVWEKSGQLKKSRIDRKCKSREYINWVSHFVDLAQIQMYNEAIDGDKKIFYSKHMEYGETSIWVPAPPYLDVSLIFGQEDAIRKDTVRLLHKVKWMSPKLFENEYIPGKMRYWPEGDMSNAIDRIRLEDSKWEKKYQEIQDAGQLFIAVSGVWK